MGLIILNEAFQCLCTGRFLMLNLFILIFKRKDISLHHSFIHILKMLSRKVEGLDPVKP